MLGTTGQTQALPLGPCSWVGGNGERQILQHLPGTVDDNPQSQPPAPVSVLGEEPRGLARQAHLFAPEASPAALLEPESAQVTPQLKTFP